MTWPGGSRHRVRSTAPRADGPSGTSTQGYDPDGQLTQRIDAAGTADFTYVNGRPATVTDPVTRVLQTLGYNTAGQLASIDYGSSRVRTIGYDACGRMNSDVLKAGSTSVSSIAYGYDADNNITSKNTTGVAGAGNNTYAYDQLGRLTSWTKGTTTTAYGWDANSNRIKAGTALASYDERNRLLNDGTSTYTYSPRGALLSQTTTTDGTTTTEAFSFDAFDRMITRSDRDFTYDALDRPVQAGTARMRYDGFSDEVVSDGTQFFGRSASDGLLAVGYDTTKRLVLADRHGDVIAGFDPADTTLGAGLPDTRTYDPFGNSTNATGLKYRIGYQGDWTDPRSGDINQGARWYNPGTGTFNTRDTITQNAGTTSSVLNLYAYAGGNPITLNDPDGHRPSDPELDPRCRYVVSVEDLDDDKRPVRVCPNDPPKPPPPPVGGCQGDCDTGCKKDCDTGCKKNCDPPCKSPRCQPKPPPPAVCDAVCQKKKEAEKKRKDLEQDAKTVEHEPPGDPVCANGNPALCPSDPSTPTTVVTSGGDLTDETVDWSNQQYQDALNEVGSVVDSVSDTGGYNWFTMGLDPREAPPAADGGGRGLGVGGISGGGGSGTGGGLGDFVRRLFGRGSGNAQPTGVAPVFGPPCGCTPQVGVRAPSAFDDLLNGRLPSGAQTGRAPSCNSFTADALVLMADGTWKPIAEVSTGDQVMAVDPTTGKLVARTVVGTRSTDGSKDIVRVRLSVKNALGSARTTDVSSTFDHLFYENGRGWRRAGDLDNGDRLRTIGVADQATVLSKSTETRWSKVYNLTVDISHTFFIWADGVAVLVHNDDVPGVGTIVRQNGITIQIYSNDHGPPHAHVKGGGSEVRIGQNGKPLKGSPELTQIQREVVNQNITTIRDNVRVAMARYGANGGC